LTKKIKEKKNEEALELVRRADNCQMDQLGKCPRADLLHGGGAMGLDGPLADAEDIGDLATDRPRSH
jgi:hypothetical protein